MFRVAIVDDKEIDRERMKSLLFRYEMDRQMDIRESEFADG